MTVDIQHVPKQTETVMKTIGDPKDDDEILGQIEERNLYRVERELVVSEEQYIIHTVDAMSKEKRTYWIQQNDDGEWYVSKVRKNPNRGHAKIAGSNIHDTLSTPTVREELQEKAGIEVIN